MALAEFTPYMLKKLPGVSYKPVLSVGNYISLDIECIVAGSSDKTIRFIDSDSLEEIGSVTMDKKNVSFVAISEMSQEGDDPVIITGGKDSIINVWDPVAGNVDKSIEVPAKEVRSIDIYQGSEILAVIGTKDGQVFVWDVVKNFQVAHFSGHKASIHCVCISLTKESLEEHENDLDYLVIASGGADRQARTWNLFDQSKDKRYGHRRSISAMKVSNKGIHPLLITAGVERQVKIWDIDTGVLLRTLDGHLDQINTLTLWEGCQMLLITGSSDHTIRVYDVLSGECICVLLGHNDSVLSLTIADADNPKIISSSEDLSIIQWDLAALIGDFYVTDGDYQGTRNTIPAYLPHINYSAPEEPDREKLSKEERKLIKRERKKAQRKKNIKNNESILTSKFTSLRSSISEIPESYLQVEQIPAGNISQSLPEGYFYVDQDGNPIDPNDIVEYIPNPEVNNFPEVFQSPLESFPTGHIEFSNTVPILPSELIRPPETNEPQPDQEVSILSRIASRLSILPNKIVPEDENASKKLENSLNYEAISQLSQILVKSFVHPFLKMNATVGIEPLQNSNISITENENIPSSEEKELTSQQPEITEENPKNNENNQIQIKLKEQNVKSVKQIHTETNEDFRKQAINTQTKYNIAIVESQIENDRKKNKASEKLAMRLNLKKKGKDGDSSTIQPEDTVDKETSEFHQVKAEKLKQHKLQEQRRKQSMAVAKNRSAQALQKRLEDLANKRKSLIETQSMKLDNIDFNEGDDDDLSDDDS